MYSQGFLFLKLVNICVSYTYVSLAFRKYVWFHYYIFIISEWPVPLQNCVPTNAYWWVRCKQPGTPRSKTMAIT